MAEKRRKKQEQGKPVQAAALGAVLAVTEAVGQTLGIHGEVEDGQERTQSEDPETGGSTG